MSKAGATAAQAHPLAAFLALRSRATGSFSWRPRLRFLALAVATLALAALSLLRPSAPTTDPWGWILWGRELLHLDLNTATVLSPSWKPLPVLITTPLALLGNAAPLVWLVVARAAGLGALAMVYAVADRLAGRLAGVVAATTLALSAGWLRAMEHGYSEPLLVLLLIAAIYRHLDGRRLQALALGALVGLGRPEIWPLLLFYAVVLWRGLPGRRLAIAGLVSVVPVLWFGGDLLGSGDAFHGREVAGRVSARLDPLDVLAAVPNELTLSVVALATLGWTMQLRSDRRVAALGWVAAVWIVGFSLLVGVGYPASVRFVVLPCALLCVLAGVGAQSTLRSSLDRRLRLPIAATALIATALYLPVRLSTLGPQVRSAEREATLQAHLRALARRPDVAARAKCGTALPAGLTWNAGALAWDLGRSLPSTQRIIENTGSGHGVAFRRASSDDDGWVAVGGCKDRRPALSNGG